MISMQNVPGKTAKHLVQVLKEANAGLLKAVARKLFHQGLQPKARLWKPPAVPKPVAVSSAKYIV